LDNFECTGASKEQPIMGKRRRKLNKARKQLRRLQEGNSRFTKEPSKWNVLRPTPRRVITKEGLPWETKANEQAYSSHR
jgi:hypothetical protein